MSVVASSSLSDRKAPSAAHHKGKGFLWQKFSSQKLIFSPQIGLCGDF
jgi:hypothetical protein